MRGILYLRKALVIDQRSTAAAVSIRSCWRSSRADGENMENYGVPPDVLIHNTPGDFVKGRDAQIEKAVEVLKAQLSNPRKTSTTSRQR